MEKKELLTKGKAKELYKTTDESKLVMDFTDDTSAFDGKKIEQLAGKGTVNNRFNNFIMNHLDSKGIACHLLEELNDRESLVLSLDMFPIECVVRNYAAGSICKRLGLEEGMKFENPIFEFFYKDDDLGDPMINDNHIISFGWAEADDIEILKKTHIRN